jgi:Phage integrase family
VSVVPFPAQATPAANPAVDSGGESVATAVDRYLDSIQITTTRASYAETLAHLTVLTGTSDTDALGPEDYAAVMSHWDDAAAATWNRHLSALTSFTIWAQCQEILTPNPGRRLERRKPAGRGDRSIPRARLDKLFTDDRHDLRERVLWRMLYETAARAEEILSLNIEDLELELRRARVHSKGGAIEYVHWATGTARLLPRLLRGRTSGPVFLADRRAPPPAAARPRPPTSALRPGAAGCPTRAPSTCSSRPPPPSIRTRRAGRSTSCGTPRSSTWPSTAAPPPSSRPNPGTSTSPASAATSDSANRPPPESPPTPTPPPAANPADPQRNGGWRNSARVGPLTPLAVRLLLKPRNPTPATMTRKTSTRTTPRRAAGGHGVCWSAR